MIIAMMLMTFSTVLAQDVTKETVASNQGNDGINKFGCDGRGNSCNAPGHNNDYGSNSQPFREFGE